MEQMNPQSLPVVAQASPASMGGLDEQVYSRLLRERIIFLAGQVEDNMANAICAIKSVKAPMFAQGAEIIPVLEMLQALEQGLRDPQQHLMHP